MHTDKEPLDVGRSPISLGNFKSNEEKELFSMGKKSVDCAVTSHHLKQRKMFLVNCYARVFFSKKSSRERKTHSEMRASFREKKRRLSVVLLLIVFHLLQFSMSMSLIVSKHHQDVDKERERGKQKCSLFPFVSVISLVCRIKKK